MPCWLANCWTCRWSSSGSPPQIFNYRRPGQTSSQLAQREWRTADTLRFYQAARDRHGLPPRRDRVAEAPLYGAGWLLRGYAGLECPDAELPADVHQVGPCRWEPDTPAEELSEIRGMLDGTGKRVVYAQ